jgi:hypothetical protein
MWLENKYISLVSVYLQQFKKRNDGYNFRCPYCGDSKTSKTKARGWFYNKKGTWLFHCFNCETKKTFVSFLKDNNPLLYKEYRMESISQEKTPEQTQYEEFVNKLKPKAFIVNTPLKSLKKVSQLSPDNGIKKYIVDRHIPNQYHAKLFACPKFMHFVNDIIPDKFSSASLKYDETRLLIPFLDSKNRLHAFQGRSLRSDTKIKYITIVLDETIPTIYGLDVLNPNNKTYVFEGPFDSMFIPNSIATAGGDLVSSISSLNSFNKTKLDYVIVYDNEPRSEQTKNKIDKAIMNGYSVCIWPNNLHHKDINDMILAGMSKEFIKYIIDQNTYKDLAAKLALQKWSKV